MREIASGVYLEKKFPGVQVAAITGNRGLMLVDCPLQVEDGREWLTQLAELGKAKYLVLLDHHPDRVLGSRGLDVGPAWRMIERAQLSLHGRTRSRETRVPSEENPTS